MRVHAFACAHSLSLPDASCRCAGTTAADADGRGGECHENTVGYYRCEYSRYPGEYAEHARVLSRCRHVPALRCAADESAADSAAPSHAVIAQPHLSLSAEAEPSTGPDERTAQPGRPPPAAAAGGAALVAIRAAARVVGAAALLAIPSFPRTARTYAHTPRHNRDHSPLADSPRMPIPTNAESH